MLADLVCSSSDVAMNILGLLGDDSIPQLAISGCTLRNAVEHACGQHSSPLSVSAAIRHGIWRHASLKTVANKVSIPNSANVLCDDIFLDAAALQAFVAAWRKAARWVVKPGNETWV